MKHFSPVNDVAILETVIKKNNQTCRVLVGDCIEAMRLMADQSVSCCVTSPPYYALRDYGVDGQIGLEQTPEEYIQKMVEVFREVKRVLRDDGTLWLNIGDSYASRNSGNNGYRDGRANRTERRASGVPNGIKEKDLIGIPWMLAFALRADGWYLRQDIIWNKPNAMPESAKDRCTKSHEYLFLLSKSPRYHYDHETIKEPAKWERWGNQTESKQHIGTAGHLGGKNLEDLPIKDKKNKRSVWTVSTRGFKGAHFATFPPDLIEPCILAGCPEGGVVFDPFGGSGTTAGVAMKHGRNAVLCELNAEYAELIPARINSIIDVKPKKVRPKAEPDPPRDENTLDMFDLFLKSQAKK